MSTEERRLPDIFQEMLETPDNTFQAGDFDAGDAGAAGLEEMLLLARELRALGSDPMPDAASSLARARERVLQSLPAAPPLTASQPQPEPRMPFWQRWGVALAPAMAWAPATLVAFLTLVILLAVTVSVSASAMPGSPFYPVKRTTEYLALRIAPESKRGAIEDAMNYHRAEEIQYARDRGILVRVPYEGVVEDCHGNLCTIGAFTVAVTPEMAANLRPGDRVQVVIQVQPDDSLVAVSMAPGRTPTPTPAYQVATGEPGVVGPGGVIKSLPTDTPAVVKVPPTKKPTQKPKATKPPTRKPTTVRKGAAATSQPTRQKQATATRPPQRKVRTATTAPLKLPQATSTKPPQATVAPTATPAPTKPPKSTPKATPRRKPGIGTSTPVPRKPRVTPGSERSRDRDAITDKRVIKGKINRVYRPRGRVVWTVIGRYRVYLTKNTKVVGKITVGQRATARIYRKNGRWYASKITVTKSSSGSKAAPTPTPSNRRVKPKPPAPTPTPVGTHPPVRRP